MISNMFLGLESKRWSSFEDKYKLCTVLYLDGTWYSICLRNQSERRASYKKGKVQRALAGNSHFQSAEVHFQKPLTFPLPLVSPLAVTAPSAGTYVYYQPLKASSSFLNTVAAFGRFSRSTSQQLFKVSQRASVNPTSGRGGPSRSRTSTTAHSSLSGNGLCPQMT